ncbi:MAG TPA: hypothetical protein VIH99_08755 [Bdellovibrionota bacterium]|jgi:hypothetical protein
MSFIQSLLFLFVSLPAFAQPPEDVVKMVNDSLRRGISYKAGEPTHGFDGCVLTPVEITGADPVTGNPRKVKAVIYEPNRREATHTVLLMPPTGGENFMDRGYADTMCGKDFRVAILQRWDFDTQRDLDLGTFDRAALRTLAAAEHLLEYLRPTKPVGILGTSLGALGASFIMSFDPRVQAGVLIVGGDNLDEIIAHSDESGVAQLRQKQMEKNGFRSVDEYQQAMKSAIRLHPSTFAGYSGPKNVKMYMGMADTTVPTKNQIDLQRALGNPSVVKFDGSHGATIFNTYMFEVDGVVSFLQQSL